jgi:(4S)-4-hydroxy-5-phosphonooxypentane-2,3-dione isomerase
MESYVITVSFDINPEARKDFLRLMIANAEASLAQEPGCLRFDVLVPEDGDGEVFLYEVYTSRAAFDLHLASDHFRAFDRATASMVARKTARSYVPATEGTT